MCWRIEPRLVLHEHAGVRDIAQSGNPLDGRHFHEEVFKTHKQAVDSCDTEDESAIRVDASGVGVGRHLKHRTGKQEGENRCHSAARQARGETEEEDMFGGNARIYDTERHDETGCRSTFRSRGYLVGLGNLKTTTCCW